MFYYDLIGKPTAAAKSRWQMFHFKIASRKMVQNVGVLFTLKGETEFQQI